MLAGIRVMESDCAAGKRTVHGALERAATGPPPGLRAARREPAKEIGEVMPVELRVDPRDAAPEMIEAAFAEVLADAREPGPEVWNWAVQERIDLAALGEASLGHAEPLERDFGLSVAVTVVGTLAAQVLADLWEDFVRPRIRKNFNVDAGEPAD
jgi:hypothetical protein